MWTTPLIIIAIVLIGLSVYYYYYYHKVEKFTEPQVNIQDAVDGLTQLLASVGSGNIPEGNPYVEKLETVPSSLKFYLTSFSQRTKYDNGLKVYLPEMHRWYNFIKANESFFVRPVSISELTASIHRTDTIGGGMPLKKVALEGLRSDELNMTDYKLKSFSATFFMTFANTGAVGIGSTNAPPRTFTVPEKCELFTISLESPNFVKLSLIDSTVVGKCNFVLQVGTDTNKITGDIPKSNLISDSPVAITISCKIDAKVTMNMYIGKYGGTPTPDYSSIITIDEKVYTPDSPLILGNSRMSINKNQSELDANLLAFMLFSEPLGLSEHKAVTTYLAKENIPTTGILSTLNTAATAQLQNIRDLIATNTATQGTLQEQLDACKKASIVKTPVVTAFSHLINMDGVSDVTKEDLRSCSVLEVRNRLTNVLAATSTSNAIPRFQINMPHGSSSNVTPIPPSS